jgi:hypothetical protein
MSDLSNVRVTVIGGWDDGKVIRMPARGWFTDETGFQYDLVRVSEDDYLAVPQERRGELNRMDAKSLIEESVAKVHQFREDIIESMTLMLGEKWLASGCPRVVARHLDISPSEEPHVAQVAFRMTWWTLGGGVEMTTSETP